MNNKMNEIYREVMDLITKRLGEGIDPMVIAAVLSTTSLSIYKTVLTEDGEYDRIVDTISNRRDEIKAFGDERKNFTLQ